jgi:hypothetical protein
MMPDASLAKSLVNAIQGRADETDLARLTEALDSRYSHRIDAYRESHIGRVVGVLGSTVLAQAEVVFGSPLLSDLLRFYFGSRPPKEDSIDDSLVELVAFVQQFGQEGSYRLLLADLIRACLEFWSLAKGHDPVPYAAGSSTARLSSSTRLVRASESIDLFGAWIQPQERPADPAAYCCGVKRSLLLVKTDSRRIVSVPVIDSLIPLVKMLVQGVELNKAIPNLHPQEVDLISQTDFKEFIEYLTRESCWAKENQ